MGRVKGITILDAVKFLRARREDAFAVLPPAMQGHLDDRIASSMWYPESDLVVIGERSARAHTLVYGDLIRGVASNRRSFAPRGLWGDLPCAWRGRWMPLESG